MYEISEVLNNYYIVDICENGKGVIAMCTRCGDAEAIVAALQQAESGGSAATNKPRNAISALASEWILKHGMAPAFKSELRAFARWAQKQASVG